MYLRSLEVGRLTQVKELPGTARGTEMRIDVRSSARFAGQKGSENMPAAQERKWTSHDNDFFLERFLEEDQPAIQRLRQRAQVQPHVERRLRGVPHLEPDLFQPLDDKVSFLAKDALEDEALRVDEGRVEERDGGDLEGVRSAAIEEGTALPEGGDERFGPDHPVWMGSSSTSRGPVPGGGLTEEGGARQIPNSERAGRTRPSVQNLPTDTPTWEPPTLSQPSNQDDVVRFDVFNEFSRRDLRPFAQIVNVLLVKLVQDHRRPLPRQFDHALQIFAVDDLTRRVVRVREEQRRDAHVVDHLLQPVDREVVPVFGFEDGRNGDDPLEGGEHLVVARVLRDAVEPREGLFLLVHSEGGVKRATHVYATKTSPITAATRVRPARLR